MLPPLSPAEKRRFEAEIVPHLDVLYRMAQAVCGDRDLADDVAQEAFLRALKGFGGLKPGTNSRAWLARIVHNTCRDLWRARARRPEQDWDDITASAIEAMDSGDDWQPAVIRGAFADEIELALRALPPRWRASVLLVDVEGWSYEEAAASLEIAPGTLRSGLHRARRALYVSLDEAWRARGGRPGTATDAAAEGTADAGATAEGNEGPAGSYREGAM